MAVTTRLTIEDFEQLPGDQVHYKELVDGELVDVSGNTPLHNKLRDRLIRLLGPVVEPDLGLIIAEQEYDFDGNAHGPDVTLIDAVKIPLMNDRKRVQRFVPDLAIEIVSQNDTFTSLMKKAKRYRTCGTAEVWVFDPEARLGFVLSGAREEVLNEDRMFESALLPGISVRMGDLFDGRVGRP